MRQAGFKPKSHDSGVYWIRANSGNNKTGASGEKPGILFWSVMYVIVFIIISNILL